MRSMTETSLLDRITAQYLQSGDFNGFGLGRLGETERDMLRSLVEKGLISIVFGDVHPNPHIRALPDEPAVVQLQKLERVGIEYACAYPTGIHLQTVVNAAEYIGRPYVLALAMGAAQLDHCAFDLHVLEPYRNDPRYWYESDDIKGHLSARSNTSLSEADEVVIRFGFAYDADKKRYVAPFLRDLSRLSPEHQQIWRPRQVGTQTFLHPDYFRTAILGEWPQGWPIYAAFVEELRIINAMTKAMGRVPLFRSDFKGGRPKEFSALLRPTLREFNDFARLLDGMVSDNIDVAFFKGEVPLETEKVRPDGKIEVARKGTLTILREWIDANFRTADREPIEHMHRTFKEVRKLRNKPSHSVQEDEFSPDIIERQRELIRDAYVAIRTLRQIFANHPLAGRVDVNEALFEGNIWIP